MKALLTLLLVFLSITFVYAQEDEDAYEYDSLPSYTYNCGWNKSLSIEERNKIFPFSQAKNIVLLAYPNHGVTGNKINQDSLDIAGAAKHYNMPVLNKWIVESKYRNKIYFSTEEVGLSKKGINELSNLLFNYTIDEKLKYPVLTEESTCYSPRNAILFFDEKDNLIACIEICFECMSIYLIKGEDDILHEAILEFRLGGYSCNEKFTLLREFFIEQGIDFGAVNID
ncbi:hypothetical protein [Flavobacterium beibuense]|uniref:Uncharacterized protein n=1 Tax=Flavobacterium beibuense TaxID=657326 RepID=A0A444W8Y5_9FLAO|nr:hypothetical protein [Flavobacterium beibuense]RYJ42375.1 hypothetical protein NU09_2161 [Flavobacterium beibuense]